jgi:hypothetical protein
MKNLLDRYFINKMGWIKPKKTIHATIPLSSENVFFSLLFFAGMILAGGVTSLCKQWIKLGGKL